MVKKKMAMTARQKTTDILYCKKPRLLLLPCHKSAKQWLNTIVAFLLISLIINVSIGINYTSHTCATNGQTHTDINLLLGLGNTICLDNDSCCSNHHTHDKHHHKKPCSEKNYTFQLNNPTLINKRVEYISPLQIIELITIDLQNNTIVTEDFLYHKINQQHFVSPPSWQAFSGVFRC